MAGETPAEGQGAAQKTSVDALPELLTALREAHSAFMKNTSDPTRLVDLGRRVDAVVTGAGKASGLHRFSKLAVAVGALLKELHEKPKCINPSALRTVAQSLDGLTLLFERRASGDEGDTAQVCILVVEDEEVVRRAVSYALEREGLRTIRVGDASTALKILVENSFDLVALNIAMAGVNGFELCAKLREMSLHVKTPIIFITGEISFEPDLQAALSNGGDLIAKPFLSTEMLVKSLTLLAGAYSVFNPQP